MTIDTSSYAAAAGAPKTLADYNQENQQVQQNALNLQSSRQKLDAYTTDQNMLNQFRGAFTPGVDQSSPAFANSLYAADPQRAAAFMKTQQDQATSRALANKDQGAANESAQKIKDQAFAHYQNELGTVQTPEEAAAFITASYNDPNVGSMLQAHGSLQDGLARLDQAVKMHGFDGWKANATIGFQHIADAAKVQQVDSGSKTDTQIVNPITGTTQTVGSVQNTPKPGEILAAQTSRANNRDTIASENARAGVVPGGGLTADAETTAHAIANGQLPPPSGMALTNPKNQRILARVMEINPDYDFTSVTAKKTAATAFTTGAQGVQLNKFATTGEHLDQLLPLIDALHNGDNQTVNAVGNAVSKWNGGTAVTNFDAVKAVATKEMMAALVAGGGDAGERKELSDSLKDANAPKLLKEVVTAYRGLMGAKEDNLMEQRRAAGLPDATMPHYHKSGGPTAPPAAAGVPDDIAAILAKHGTK